jgi:kynurenine 3-monooxygenase
VRTPRDTAEITLVGAGLAGSLLAIFLARRGYRVTLLERRMDPRPRKTEASTSAGRSINLALANRGIAALEEVGVMESVRAGLIPMAGRMLHDEEGRLRLIPYGNKPHEVIYSVSRAGLNELLLDAAESTGKVSIRFGETVGGVDFANRRVLPQTTPYDVLIGTDGSASAVRAAILERTGGRLDEKPLGHGYKELSIPAADGSGSGAGAGGRFRMEKNALHIWPRGEYMLIALPNVDGSFTATLFLPNEGEESFEALTTPDAVHALFERRFADAIPLMPRLVEDFFGNPTGHLETIRCEPWSFEDHALVLGDAAHAIVPFHGQGMNAAFEDCSAFDRCLENPDRSWESVFAEFETRRRRDRRHGPGELRRDAIDRPGAEVPAEERSCLPPRGKAPRPVHPPLLDGDVPHDSLRRRQAAGSDSGGNPRRADEPGGEPRRGRPGARRPDDRRAAGNERIARNRSLNPDR